jgi:serine/threonine protein kinase
VNANRSDHAYDGLGWIRRLPLVRETVHNLSVCGMIAQRTVQHSCTLTPSREMADSFDGSWASALDKLRAATAGEFVIGDELGRRGFAAVFLAHDVRGKRRVAIKVLSPMLSAGEGMVQRFMDEAVMMANLRHPNIITVYSVRETEGLQFFVMQFVAGRSPEQVVRHVGALPVTTPRAMKNEAAERSARGAADQAG